MADSRDTTRIVIDLESRLRNLERTTRGLNRIEAQLKRIAAIKPLATASGENKRTQDLKRFAEQHRRAVEGATKSTQNLTRTHENAKRVIDQLNRSQDIFGNTVKATSRQMDAHVRVFRAQQQAAQGFNRQIAALGNSFRSIGQGLASVGATLTFSVTAPLIALGSSIVDAATRMDSLTRGLTTMAGSSREAAVQLERLTRIAKLPGIGFEEAIQGSIRLQAVGFSAAEAERALRQFSNAIALTGGGREDLANVTVQLGQMAAQSKVLAQDLKPIISSAPAVAQVMREAFGTVRSEEIQELGVSSREFIDTLIAGMERLPRAAAGARNSFENFRDELFRAAAVVGTTLLPALTRLVEVVGPIITTLANAFAALPVPLQVIGVGFVALLAAIGPVTFVVGVLVTGIGRLLVGFAQLNATGILPTIANLRALTAGTLGAAAAQRTLAATTALVAGGVGVLLTALAAVVTAFALYKAFQKDSLTLTKEQVSALDDEIKGLKEQAKFIGSLSTGVERTTDEQERLLEIYKGLNTEAKVRVTGITDEEKRLAELRTELEKIILLREREREQQTAALAAQLAGTLQSIEANEKSRQSIAGRVQANVALAETLEREGKISIANAQILERRGISVATVAAATFALRKESENLIDRQSGLIKKYEELNGTAKQQAEVLQGLGVRTEEQARQVLAVAANMGLFKGRIDDVIPTLRRYIDFTDQATGSTDRFNRALSESERRLSEAGKQADELQKKRQSQIASAAATAREASSSLEDALRLMQFLINTTPELRASLERESQIAGKSVGELMRKAVENAFGGRDRVVSGRGLRNALQQLADAEAEVGLAQKDREVEIEKDGIEAQLRAAEVGHRLRLLSYREYLENRATLTGEALDKEINQQQEVVKAAREAQIRLLAEAKRPGLEADERARRQAQAAQAEEEAIKAETKLIILQRQRERITTELQQALAEAQQQQIADIAQLEIRYAELQGRIEDALKAATVEEFREQLETLGKAQKFLNEQVNKATGERKKQLEVERQLNQRQIESVQNQIRARDALAQLAAAEKLVENAKTRQAQLEEDLRVEVEFRGLSEETAIERRLEGERRLRASMSLARSIIEDARQALIDFGATPPPQLEEFIANLKREMQGLGELSFSEQFRLAEKEFNRINDERLQRIADVERAVNNRTIAEAEGLLFIRRINGEYVGDLERQLTLLKEIATASGDVNLQRQAQTAEETVKDANDRLADFDKQLRSVSIDALRDGFTDFFSTLTDRTTTAKEKLLDLVNSVANRIQQVIAENLSEKLIESLFGGGEGTGEGIIASLKRLFGFGGPAESAKAVVADVAGKAGESTAAASALTAGATAAATALTTGGTAAATAIATAITAAAATFAAAVTAAGAAFAASVAAGQIAGSAGQGLAGLAGGAATGLFPAVPGGAIHIVEGGYPEAVLTTDPKHAARQVGILRELLARTRGFYGRVRLPEMPSFAKGGFPELASGGMVSREAAEANLLSAINRAPTFSPTSPTSALETAGGAAAMNLRIVNQVTSRELARPYLTSEEGVRDVLNIISTNSNEIYRRLPVRG